MSSTLESQITIAPSGGGHAVQVLTDLCRTKLTAQQTGRAYTVHEAMTGPPDIPRLMAITATHQSRCSEC